MNKERLLARLGELAEVGAIGGGGVCRIALSDADMAGRDLVMSWMKQLDMSVTVDRIGNVVGVRAGLEDAPPVMTGSHIDTVATGGRYDGNLGVLAGLELVQVLAENDHVTKRPIAVGFFTNEEGARFAPDMMGSGVHQGMLSLSECLAATDRDSISVGEELHRIGYAGSAPCPGVVPGAFVELHIEQGPVLEREGIAIGAVDCVQGISWTEVSITGVSNHAGTTPMSMRHDANFAAAELTTFVRRLALEIGGSQVATVGFVQLSPNLVNVVPNRATMTIDLRNTDEAILQEAEQRTFDFAEQLAAKEGVEIEWRSLVRFEPVTFAEDVVASVEAAATKLGHSVRRMPSGAGHDAQMFAPNCPAGMIFVPSRGGISHNVAEHTDPDQIEAGANVLLQVVLGFADE